MNPCSKNVDKQIDSYCGHKASVTPIEHTLTLWHHSHGDLVKNNLGPQLEIQWLGVISAADGKQGLIRENE